MVTALARVPVFMGEALSYRTLTSDPNVESRSHSSYTAFTGLITSRTSRNEWDDRRASFVRVETTTLIAPSTIALKQGDQIKDGSNIIWAIDTIDSSGPGTITYTMKLAVSTMATGGDRGGGV